MKKLHSILITLALALLFVIWSPVQTKAASGDVLTFQLVDGQEYHVQSCKLTATGEVTIPATYNGLPVTGIIKSAFEKCAGVTRIVVPEGVEFIGEYAFRSCSELTEISLPNTLNEVSENAFDSCPKLPLTTYDNAIYVGSAKNPYVVLLRRTNTSITQCNIHPDTKVLASSAFTSCRQLTEITLPRGVLGIGDHVFSNCDKLTTITIPDTVVKIGYDAFGFCRSLTTAYLPDVITWSQVWRADVYADPDLYADDIYYNGKKVTDLVIPGHITKVGDYAFGNSQFKSITIEEGVKEIGQSAFSDCTGVTKLTMADSVTTIGEDAFAGCNGLTEVKLGKGVTKIGAGAFYKCKGMTSITIPKGVKTIGEKAFEECTALKAVTVPSGVTELGSNAFYKCTALTDVTLPDSITIINSSTFRHCSSLKNVKLGNRVIRLMSHAFSDCTALESIELPLTLEKVDANALGQNGLKRVIFQGTQAAWIKVEIAVNGTSMNMELLEAEIVCLGLTEPVVTPEPEENPTEPSGGNATEPSGGNATEPSGTTPPQESTDGTESAEPEDPNHTPDASAPGDEATDPAAPTGPEKGAGKDQVISWLWIPLVILILAGGVVAGVAIWKQRKK